MIDWCPLATRLDGPTWKLGYDSISVRDWRGAVFHSMEGSIAGAHSVLQGPKKSSWHFSNPKTGPLEQHYPISTVAWHGGSLKANRRFVGVEHEGVAGEPLTASQIENDVGLLLWLAENDVYAWPGFIRHDTLWEHRELIVFGSTVTECPSGRIPWEEVIAMATVDEQARKDIGILRQINVVAAAAQRNDMGELVTLLRAFGILDPNVQPLKPALTGT